MNYTKIQKIISFIVLFSFFSTSIFSFPSLSFFSKTSASSGDFYNLVSILVDEEIYQNIDAEIERYAKDIQSNLENTRAIILPVPLNSSSFNIASLNEGLFFEGYKSLDPSVDFNSKLVGTVLVGNINLPVINNSTDSSVSIAPYVDFEDKSFIYNHNSKEYLTNIDSIDKFKAEIWHGVISPNTGDISKNILELKQFFDKDHNFYTGKGLFEKSEKVLNGKKLENLNEKYNPYVFYYDQFREEKSIHYPAYKGYKAYLENKEDLNYNRYSKELASKVQNDVLGAQNQEFDKILSNIKDDNIKDIFKKTTGPDTTDVSAVSTRLITQKSVNTFIESFNKGMISDIRTNVHNAGRYNEKTNKVNVDLVPYLVSVLDEVTDKTILDVNKQVENKIKDLIVEGGLARNIAIPVTAKDSIFKGNELLFGGISNSYSGTCVNVDRNYLYGKYADNINTAKDCSIYRGSDFNSGTLVEASRGLNINLVGSDINKLTGKNIEDFKDSKTRKGSYRCLSTVSDGKGGKKIDPVNLGIWGGYSPLNIDMSSNESGALNLGPSSYKKAIEPLFDISGAKKVLNGKNPSPLDCLDNNLLSYERRSWNAFNYGYEDSLCSLDYKLGGENWTCKNDNEVEKNLFSDKFEDFYKKNYRKTIEDIEKCGDTVNIHKQDGKYYSIYRYSTKSPIFMFGAGDEDDSGLCMLDKFQDSYSFKFIPSYIIHNSPESDELYTEIKSNITPNLPIDKVRYIDFISRKGNYIKIEFPNLFNTNSPEDNLSLTEIEGKFDEILKAKSDEINSIIKSEDPSTLTGLDKEISTLLSKEYSSGQLNDSEYDSNLEESIDSAALSLGLDIDKNDNKKIQEVLKTIGENKNIETEIIATNDILEALKIEDSSDVDSGSDEDNEKILQVLTELGKTKYAKIESYTLKNDGKLINYPSDDIDLNSFLSGQTKKEINIGGLKKTMNYRDFVAFSMYWNNLNSVSAKYKFIIENYLSDQVGGNNFDFILPKNKSEYEIAYMGAAGDSQNMYIKLDPEEKKTNNPYASLISSNGTLDANRFGLNLVGGSPALEKLPDTNMIDIPSQSGLNKFGDSSFKCAPPEGVNLWEWIPAVVCRLKNMLPPKIGLSEGDCGVGLLGGEDLDLPFDENQGSSLISQEIAKYKQALKDAQNSTCNGDFNKNGINDCLEQKLAGATLDFKSDASRYYYSTNAKLINILKDKNNKRVYIDNTTVVNFTVDKIIDREDGNNKIVFDSSKEKYSDSNYSKYINFKEIGIRNKAGKAEFNFNSSRKDVDVYFKTKLFLKNTNTGNNDLLLTSNSIKIEVRGDRMFLTSLNKVEGDLELGGDYAIANEDNIHFVLNKKGSLDFVNDKIKNGDLVLSLSNINKNGKNIDYEYPLNIRILDSNLNPIYETNINSFSEIKKLLSIKKSGNYKIIIKDSKGFTVKKDFEVKANKAERADFKLGTNILENNGSISTNFIVIYDRYDNPVTGDLYDLELDIDGNSLVFNGANTKKVNFTTIEGFRAFRIKSTNNTGVSKVNIGIKKDGVELFKVSKSVNVVGNVKLEIKNTSNLEVGNKKTSLEFNVLDENGSLLSNLNSRVYLLLDNKYGIPSKAYFDIVNGKANIDFISSKIAGNEIPFKFQIEGFKTIFIERFDIKPLKPLKVQIIPSKTKFEASVDSYTTLNIELKDAYGNLVFTDNNTTLNLEILNEYKDIVSSKVNSKKIIKGKASFKIYASDIPGKAYVKISSTPDLSNNSFEIKGQSPFLKARLNEIYGMRKDGILTTKGKTFFYEIDDENYRFRFNSKDNLLNSKAYKNLNYIDKIKVLRLFISTNKYIINGVGSNVIGLETFFFWKAENIKGKKYNSLYTILLGAAYGDITKKDYLASGILFDKDNRGLTVTSLIANPYSYRDILNIDLDGNFKKILNSSDLTQDIDFELSLINKKPVIELYNKSLSTDIGKIFFNFGSNTEINVCENINCILNNEETSILGLKSNGNFHYEKNGDNLVLLDDYSNKAFSIGNKGEINLYDNISFSLSEIKKDYIVFDVMLNGKNISKLGFNFIDGKIKTTKDNLVLNGLLRSSENAIIIKLSSENYGIRELYTNNSSKKLSIYYKDPFIKENSLNSFVNDDFNNFENIVEKEGLGWKGGNKALLSFSAGKSVGDSIKDYQSILTVNLGDPVVSLKKKKIRNINGVGDKKFDRTIGKKINKEDIEGYKIFDYNKDGKDDILFIKNDKYLSLQENYDIEGNFVDLKNLARIEDIGDVKLVQVGDFTGDGYDDIFFVNNKGNPFILNNNLKDFLRIDLTKQFDLDAKITISEVFDMDNDGIDDIVTLDDNGTINIFYGTNNSSDPKFTKNEVYSGYGIKLSSEPRNDYGLVYFSGVSQLDEHKANLEAIKSAENFNKEINDALNAGRGIEDVSSNDKINDGLLDSLIYAKVSYDNKNGNLSKEDSLNDIVAKQDNTDISQDINNAQNSLSDFMQANTKFVGSVATNATTETTFIRSQYSETVGLKVEKIFKDRNGGNLKSGDIVTVEVKLKNITSHNILNIAYIEDFSNNFSILNDSIKNDKNKKWKTPQSGGKFLIDGFDLAGGEELVINYNLKAKGFKFGFIEVGLFEQEELGDDLFGDIIFKTNENNCSQTVDIFRSIAKRSYEKGFKKPICDTNKLELPEELNKPDADNNGVPDYIDKIINDTKSGDSSSLQDFSNDKLNNFYKDTDFDGIPDNEDRNPEFGDDEDLLGQLDKINEKVDDISQGIDTIVEGLGCGFGGGSCLALPMNWAPLAPGNDPTLYGIPVGDGLKVGEGLPIFSSLTGLSGPHCVPIPTVWPVSPYDYPGGTCGGSKSAGGRLGTRSATNTFRLFYTPTLTGGQGIAACFGGPAIVVGSALPPGISPILPGGNCIVAASSIGTCNKDDEDLGDPTSMGVVTYMGGNGGGAGAGGNGSGSGFGNGDGFGVINGNCDSNTSNKNGNTDGNKNGNGVSSGKSGGKLLPETNKIDLGLVSSYMEYKRTGIASSNLITSFSDAFGSPAGRRGSSGSPVGLNGTPLLSLDGGNNGLASMDANLDISSLMSGNFEDVVQVKNTRISAFPDFLMDWVTRQIEEIVTKLTDFPTLSIILPDFSSIYDTNWIDYIDKGVEESYNEGKVKQAKKDDKLDSKIQKLQLKKSGRNCDGKDGAYCKSIDNQIGNLQRKKGTVFSKQNSGISQTYEFLSSVPIITIEPQEVGINIPWIDEYTLTKTISDWKNTLDQWKSEGGNFSDGITLGKTCSGTANEIKSCEEENSANQKYSDNLNGLISSLEKNIAILEDWKDMPEKLGSLVNKKQERLDQILCNIDSISEFMGGWIGKNGKRFKAWVEAYILVKAILKSWQLLADLFIDFDAECHECKNERNDLTYFQLKLVSFIIPKIPVVKFPKWPDIVLDLHNIRLNITLNIPDFVLNKRPIVLPVLPNIQLPSTPDVKVDIPTLPILPKFEVPELPDLPTLPKIELPDLPPPPKLPKLFGSIEGVIDILKLVSKAMCIMKKSPFVPEWRAGDLIASLTERTGYIPEMDFLDVSLPQYSYSFVDSIKVTSRVNFEYDTDYLTEMVRSIAKPLDGFTTNIVNMFDIKADNFDFSELTPSDVEVGANGVSYNSSYIKMAYTISLGIEKLIYILDSNKNSVIGNKNLIYKINKSLSKTKFINDSRYEELRKLWFDVSQVTYSKQDKIISNAKKNNVDKFETLKSIINNEKNKGKTLLRDIDSVGKIDYIKVSNKINNDFDSYNKSLSKYNNIFKNNAKKLVKTDNKQVKDLQKIGNSLLSRINDGISNLNDKKLFASSTTIATNNSLDLNSCQQSNNNSVKYKYEGIYIVEQGGSYKLFDYTDELTGKEKAKPVDFDNDGDTDLLYLVDNQLYLKENFTKTDNKSYVSYNPLEVDSDDNKFLNGDYFIESINNFKESIVANGIINLTFSAPTNTNVNNFRLEFYDRIDKNINRDDLTYIPDNLKKSVIDAFSDTDNIGILEKNDNYTISKNIGYFNYIGAVPGVKLSTNKLVDITKDLSDGKIISISANKKLYSTSSNLNIYYIENGEKKETELKKYSNMYFNGSVKIYKIDGGALFIDSGIKKILKGQELVDYIGKPLLYDTEILVEDDRALTTESHIDLNYYDGSNRGIDLRKLNSYKVYDLGFKSNSYLLSISAENDYYYGLIYAISGKTIGTASKQILLSPQLSADNTAPDLNFNSYIKIPVYQNKVIDFSDYIFDDSGINSIKEVVIEKLNPPKYEILRSPGKIKIKFGKFENLFKTKIVIKLVDENGNTSKKDVGFEVYSPKPKIDGYNNLEISGKINENLNGEPINIYRVRGGIIKKIETKSNNTKVDTALGKYNFKIDTFEDKFSQKLYLKSSSNKIIDISGDTGKINSINPNYTYKVKLENDYPIIYVLDNNTEIYKEKIILNEIDNINIVSNFYKVGEDKGLYLKVSSDRYSYYVNPNDLSYNPGVVTIYRKADLSKIPLFTIFKDGRINTVNNNYTIEYSTYNDYVVYKFIDKHYNKIVGELLLKINNNFIIK